MNMHKNIIGITQGDYNGIGMEIILKSLSHPAISEFFVPVIITSRSVLEYHKEKLGGGITSLRFKEIDLNTTLPKLEKGLFFHKCSEEKSHISPGKLTEVAGKSAANSLQVGFDLLKNRKIDALVTAPINKQNIKNDSFPYVGHTEYLNAQFKESSALMVMVSENLKMCSLTEHIPLKFVSENIKAETLLSKITTFHTVLKNDFFIDAPKIAVLGLNPHASDNGTMGNEEERIISPSINALTSKNIDVFGPYSPDGFFASGNFRKFDGVFAMYHDQMMLPFKLLAFETGVNYTAGLPVIRTSPAHGTAMDLALKGEPASPKSMLQALFLADKVIKNRRKNKETPLQELSREEEKQR